MQHTHFIDVNQLINIIPVVSNAILSESLTLWHRHRRHRRVLYSVLTVRQHCITVFGVTQTLWGLARMKFLLLHYRVVIYIYKFYYFMSAVYSAQTVSIAIECVAYFKPNGHIWIYGWSHATDVIIIIQSLFV